MMMIVSVNGGRLFCSIHLVSLGGGGGLGVVERNPVYGSSGY